mgnify:CR=1 FL=1
MSKILKNLTIGVLAGFVVIALFGYWIWQDKEVQGSTAYGFPAELATTSSIEVGDGVEVLIATTTGTRSCAGRAISVGPIPILFISPGVSKGSTGTSTLQLDMGHLQLASTTEYYSSDEYGCGAWVVRAPGADASTTITVSEFRQ